MSSGTTCIHFYKVTHVCVYLDHDDEDNLAISGICGVTYDE